MNGTILNLGATEILTILVLALLVLGPERLPQLMRGIGTGLRRMRMMYVAFVTEFRNELAPIAEEVDKVTSEIQGELAAIREAADFRNVLQPALEDINKAADLSTPVNQMQADIQAPAWGFPQLGESKRPDGAAPPAESVAAEAPHPNAAEIAASMNGAEPMVEDAIETRRVTPVDGFAPPTDATDEPSIIQDAEAIAAAAPQGEFTNYRNIGFPEDEAAYQEMLARKAAEAQAAEAAANATAEDPVAKLAREQEQSIFDAVLGKAEPTVEAEPFVEDPIARLAREQEQSILDAVMGKPAEPVAPIEPIAVDSPSADAIADMGDPAEDEAVELVSPLEAGIIDSEPLQWESVVDAPPPGGPPVGVFNPLAYLAINLDNDNPWGSIEVSPRGDELDLDSPWRR
jgi:sec-independent protein translocase protein TatB